MSKYRHEVKFNSKWVDSDKKSDDSKDIKRTLKHSARWEDRRKEIDTPILSHKAERDTKKIYIQDSWLWYQVNFEDEIYFKGGRNVTP